MLDLGAGRGYLLSFLQNNFHNIVLTDLSRQMLSLIDVPEEENLKRVCASAFALPFPNETFFLVSASLADPFMREEALTEIHRVLKPGGLFIFSTPSALWSDGIRTHNKDNKFQNTTNFVHSSGLKATVYSFTYLDAELKNLLTSSGYNIESFQVIFGKDLKMHTRPVSPALHEAANNLKIRLDDLAIIQLVVCKRQDRI